MAQGQFLGPKGSYIYITDNGTAYVIRRDRTLATIPGTELAPATTATSNGGRLPQGFKPRGVYWQSFLDGQIVRKFIICGSPLSGLYDNPGSVELTVDNVVGYTTGRKGESQEFIRLVAPADVPNPQIFPGYAKFY